MTFNIPFLNYKTYAVIFSCVLLIGSAVLLLTKNINWGLDFTGGTLIEVRYEQAASKDNIETALKSAGYKNALVQLYGNATDVTIRLPSTSEGVLSSQEVNQVLAVLKQLGTLELLRDEGVGATMGEEFTNDGAMALLAALLCVMIYVAIRFEWKFAVGSVMALAHDVLIVLGLFSLIGKTFDLTVLAALLAVIGYSLNDTIVVYDRIRENFIKIRKGSTQDVMNTSLNQTLSRTIITSLTTLLTLFALYFLGGELINGFALALIAGVLVGTYSSIYVASTAALFLGVSKEDLMPPEVDKEGADQEPLV